ncbi:TetR/AcrR family transcriptional regulator [Flavobacterium sp. TMP13]|uniref:TetR/AcrR family transcriptional regulator n=1 Tax=Flavobacterium sp. TMP13 TaxID=3425950 RepID=UPI003D76DFF1
MKTNTKSIEEQISTAAFSVFIEKGYERAKMQEIADAAGISRTVLNYYFRSKHILYQKIAKSIIKQALPNMLSILNSGLSFDDKIKSFVATYIDLGIENPFIPQFAISEMNNLGPAFFTELLEGNVPNIDPFLNHVRAEIKAGNIVDIDPMQIYIHTISLCAFPFLAKPLLIFISHVEEQEFLRLIEERKTEVVRLLLNGLKR